MDGILVSGEGDEGFCRRQSVWGVNVRLEGGAEKVYFCPAQSIHDTLEAFDGTRRIYSKRLDLRPMEPFADQLPEVVPAKNLVVLLGGDKLRYVANPDAGVLARPLDGPETFDWNSLYGLYVQGKEAVRQRFYDRAVTAFDKCLKKDLNYLPALVEMAALSCRGMDYAEAERYARKALAIDTYDPGANYYYGLANKALGNYADARDGFDLASQSIEYRSAAFTELGKLYLREKDFANAEQYARRSLDFNRGNIEARQLLAVACRLKWRRRSGRRGIGSHSLRSIR